MSWLSGYTYRKPIAYTAGVGAGADYQVVVKCYYASGSDGTESLNGETVAKVYLAGKCQTDFDDVRFALSGSSTAYTHKRTSKTDSVSAVFVVKVGADMDTARVIYCYYGNASAVDASSDNALIDTITGVVLACPMDEAAASNISDYSGNNNTGTPANMATTPSNFAGKTAKQGDAASAKITFSDHASLQFGNGDFSILAFTKPDLTTNSPLFSKYGNFGYRGFIGTDGRVKFGWRDGATNYQCQTAATVVSTDWQLIGITVNRATSKVYFYHDGVVYDDNANDFNPAVNLNGVVVPTSMYDAWNTYWSSSKHGALFVFNNVISPAQQAILAANYGDPTLIAGSVLVRKWATTTLPTVSSIGPEEPTYIAGTPLERGPPAPVPKMPHEFMRLLKRWLEAKKVNS